MSSLGFQAEGCRLMAHRYTSRGANKCRLLGELQKSLRPLGRTAERCARREEVAVALDRQRLFRCGVQAHRAKPLNRYPKSYPY